MPPDHPDSNVLPSEGINIGESVAAAEVNVEADAERNQEDVVETDTETQPRSKKSEWSTAQRAAVIALRRFKAAYKDTSSKISAKRIQEQTGVPERSQRRIWASREPLQLGQRPGPYPRGRKKKKKIVDDQNPESLAENRLNDVPSPVEERLSEMSQQSRPTVEHPYGELPRVTSINTNHGHPFTEQTVQYNAQYDPNQRGVVMNRSAWQGVPQAPNR